MADVKDILGVPRNSGALLDKSEVVKEKKEKVKRPEGMSREAFALLGSAHPIISSQVIDGLAKKDLKQKPKPSSKGVLTYQLKAFTNPARTDGLQLYHWVKGYKDALGRVRDADDAEYQYAKLNKKVQVPRYDDEEWETLVRDDSSGWTREETDYLLDLCESFGLRFVVIADRYEFADGPPRTLEQLKERYYSVARALFVGREGGEAAVSNHPIVRNRYIATYETERRLALHNVLSRTKQNLAEEEAILAEAKIIEEKRKFEPGVSLPLGPVHPPAGHPPLTSAPPGGPVLQTKRATSITPSASAGPKSMYQGTMPKLETGGITPTAQSPGLPTPFQFPADFSIEVAPGIPSLLGEDVQPFKPAPGVYARGAHTREMATALSNALHGGSRAHKSVEAFLEELKWPGASLGPWHNSRPVCGAWLAMRAEVIELVELRRSLQNRTFADDSKKSAAKRKKGDDLPTPVPKKKK